MHASSLGGRPLDDIIQSVAQTVKRLRTARGLSQADLSRQSGVAKATLSQLEVGKANPTMETLFALARTLGVSLGTFLNEPGPVAAMVSRAGDRTVIEGANVDMSLIESFSSTKMLYESYLIVVRDGRQEAPPHAPGVQERILVTEGLLRSGLVSDPVELGVGDYLCFTADRTHFYEGIGGRVTAFLLMAFPLTLPTTEAESP